MRLRFRAAAAALAAAVLVLVPAALASQSSDSSSAAVASPTGAWFVELGGSVESFRSAASAQGIQYTERFAYKRAWKGVSVSVAPSDVAKLRSLPGVEAVYPVLTASVGPTEQASPDLAYALEMTGASGAQSELGLSGQGIKVAVMDTGVDYDHPDLGGCFGPGCRVATGYDFVGDRFDASLDGGDNQIPHPDGDPDDCQGHGSHVAGIIGASGDPDAGGARGVAPGVTFGAYRVFGCNGSTTADIMLAAMDRALADGMDILNMSIGSAFMTWPQYPTAVGADNLVDQGMTVVASIGNSGANGLYSAGAPGVGRKVIGVASFDNSHVELKTFTAAPDNRSFGYMQTTAAAEAPTSGTMPLTRSGTPTTANDMCNAVAPSEGSLTGKVVLIRRGTCTFHEKAVNAQKAGAIGAVLYNNVPGLFSATVAGPVAITIPIVSISDADGAVLSSRIPTALTDTIDMTWTDQTGIFPNPTSGRSSSFTSYGLTAELDLKPDIGAPGGLIRSTYPLEKNGYATISGTSMSSPHVAGAAALLLQAKPGTSPASVRTILQNSADPILFGTNPTTLIEPVHRQGAGMVDIDDAITADTLVSPGKIALGEANGGTRTISITNNGSASRTYSLGHTRAVGHFGNTFAPSASTAGASVAFSRTSVDVAPGATETVDVTFTTGALINGFLYGGYVTVGGGGKTYRVPYAGFWGDYQSIQVLAPGGCSFPGVFKAGGETECVAATPTAPAVKLAGWTRQAPTGATFDVESVEDRPVLLYHRAHQSRKLEITAIDEAGTSYLVASGEYLSRNQTNDREPTGYTVYRWDGKHVVTSAKTGVTNRRELPAGVYRLRITVTKAKAFNAAGEADQTEVWTSQPLTITRPG